MPPKRLSQRGTLNISPDDYNPERIQIDPDTWVFDIAAPWSTLAPFSAT